MRSGSSDFFKDRKADRHLSDEEILEGAMLVDVLITIVSNCPQDDSRERLQQLEFEKKAATLVLPRLIKAFGLLE